MKPVISVIIPAFNEEAYISLSLRSLEKLNPPNVSWEVIVVDNNSSDKTAAVAESFAKRLPLKVIHESKSGRGSARAAGAEAAQGDYLIYTDADTEVPPNWLEAMMVPFADAEVVAVSCDAEFPDLPKFQQWYFTAIWNTSIHWQKVLLGHNTVAGYSVAIRTSAYHKSGGFDKSLVSGEDTHLSNRLAKVGKIVFLSSVKVKTSGRRLKSGQLKTLKQYAQLFFWQTLLRKPVTEIDDPR